MAGRLHGAQSPIVGGEAGVGAETHVVGEEGEKPSLRFGPLE